MVYRFLNHYVHIAQWLRSTFLIVYILISHGARLTYSRVLTFHQHQNFVSALSSQLVLIFETAHICMLSALRHNTDPTLKGLT